MVAVPALTPVPAPSQQKVGTSTPGSFKLPTKAELEVLHAAKKAETARKSALYTDMIMSGYTQKEALEATKGTEPSAKPLGVSMNMWRGIAN